MKNWFGVYKLSTVLKRVLLLLFKHFCTECKKHKGDVEKYFLFLRK